MVLAAIDFVRLSIIYLDKTKSAWKDANISLQPNAFTPKTRFKV